MNDKNETLEKITKRSHLREDLIEKIVKNSEIIQNFPIKENFLVLSRQWNSWYPSSLNVEGGCYFFNLNSEIIIIDPGFNTLDEIRKNQLDIRLIRHVFVTHFHPDHFESLIKILTRVTSKNNPITVYMNPTTFNQFKIYRKENTDFIELKSSMTLSLEFQEKDPEIQVKVDIGKAYHKEIGGYNNSIGLKFELIDKNIKKVHKIGFMSDTDGSEKYIEEYCSFYGKCDILVIHLGAIHKEPNGYKHLYKQGTISFLNRLDNQGLLKDKYIFVGEFGFELSRLDFYRSVCEAIITESANYLILIKSFIDFSKKSEFESSLGIIYINSFEKCIKKIKYLFPTLEIIAPFFFNFNSNPNEEIMKKMKEIKIDNIRLEEIWDSFIQGVIFNSISISTCLKNLEAIALKLFDSEEVNKFKKKVHDFFKYMNPKIKNWFLNEIRKNELVNFLHPNDLTGLIKYNVIDLTREEYDADPWNGFENIVHFPKIINRSTLNEEERKKMDIVSLLLFALFTIYLSEFEQFQYLLDRECDGRQEICKIFFRKYDFGAHGLMLPVHPSYKIVFTKDVLFLEGFCSRGHYGQSRLITDYNKNWSIIQKHTEKHNYEEKFQDFIDVISTKDCRECNLNNPDEDQGRTEEDLEKERLEADLFLQEHFQHEITKSIYKINTINNLDDLITYISTIEDKDYLMYIDGNLLIEKIKALSSNIPNENLILILFNSLNFIGISAVRDFIKKKISEEVEKNKGFPKDFLLKLIQDEKQNEIDYFEFNDLNDFFISFKIEFNIIEIISLSKYFISKFDYFKLKNKSLPIYNRMFKYYIKNFIQIIYPILKNPDIHLEDLKILISKIDLISRLSDFGHPLNIYADYIDKEYVNFILKKHNDEKKEK